MKKLTIEQRVIEKAKSWVWHQTEGYKHYNTSTPDKVTSQNKARRELIEAVLVLNADTESKEEEINITP